MAKLGGCRTILLLFAVAGCIARWFLRVPSHPNPPDVKVDFGKDGWEEKVRYNLAKHGYAHIPGLLKREEVQGLRKLAEDFCYGETRKALPLSYGGYSVPNFLDVPEFAAAKWLPEDERVHTLLRAAFNGTGYRFASHNDVGCDFVGVWHKDILRGTAAKYQECDVWSPDATGEQHEIYKVMFYLQDHVHDEQAMKVIPGSHIIRHTPWEDGYVALHPTMGDTVIFDQRLSHAGNTYYDPLGKGRLFMQVGFGRANRFTDEFERGTVERQQTLHNRMLQSSAQRGLSTYLADAKFTVLGAALSALPPALLNFFADKDIKDHVHRSCASGQSSSQAKAAVGGEL
mmetsp:Transcript_36520/g.77695  ORF Transcript_36520/g.77695 Transcript_36520/m.77695 type:complete len:343 (-) Transcript_36520:52-1080(-)|eukprot:CAMPEP_0206452552 /NCGR_PEP_ID=MMETSP0324_2-20121206/20015_1 /ASSEMBLY_ACC=CAM_ASM_000836 /TAXON_ID=2866 /ORGANISM="Crypthecodinium cohnii, Strain Seligo" /LENGTH=342 /DNA_ID=CAMNT_0053922667 /DNA_START=243 /DNA_END=1271 /DNA_ORIENTATION=+